MARKSKILFLFWSSFKTIKPEERVVTGYLSHYIYCKVSWTFSWNIINYSESNNNLLFKQNSSYNNNIGILVLVSQQTASCLWIVKTRRAEHCQLLSNLIIYQKYAIFSFLFTFRLFPFCLILPVNIANIVYCSLAQTMVGVTGVPSSWQCAIKII